MATKKRRKHRLTFEIIPLEGNAGWIVEVVDIPNALSFGDTRDEAICRTAQVAAQILKEGLT